MKLVKTHGDTVERLDQSELMRKTLVDVYSKSPFPRTSALNARTLAEMLLHNPALDVRAFDRRRSPVTIGDLDNIYVQSWISSNKSPNYLQMVGMVPMGYVGDKFEAKRFKMVGGTVKETYETSPNPFQHWCFMAHFFAFIGDITTKNGYHFILNPHAEETLKIRIENFDTMSRLSGTAYEAPLIQEAPSKVFQDLSARLRRHG